MLHAQRKDLADLFLYIFLDQQLDLLDAVHLIAVIQGEAVGEAGGDVDPVGRSSAKYLFVDRKSPFVMLLIVGDGDDLEDIVVEHLHKVVLKPPLDEIGEIPVLAQSAPASAANLQYHIIMDFTVVSV